MYFFGLLDWIEIWIIKKESYVIEIEIFVVCGVKIYVFDVCGWWVKYGLVSF